MGRFETNHGAEATPLVTLTTVAKGTVRTNGRGELEGLLDRLRAGGGRVTTARRAVLTVMLEPPGDHLTAEDLAARVQERYPDIHLSTIYRTLEVLEAAGLLSHVHLGHGPSTYHLTDRPHHHAVCRVCGEVIELPAGSLDQLERRLRRDHDFDLEAQHFALVGRCADCR
ncbi:MAG: Fur family transcriptional regulator [Acidimicrobiales bacterium]